MGTKKGQRRKTARRAYEGFKTHQNPKRPQSDYAFGKHRFIMFLEDTLIPDLKESGMDATAEDFETAVFYMKGGRKRPKGGWL